MKRSVTFSAVGLMMVGGSVAVAQQTKETKPTAAKPAKVAQPAGQPEFELPPGMTMEDMQACEAAATPGEMHARLQEGVGVWQGTTTMWMTPEAEPVKSECRTTITPMLEGRFVKCKTEGDMMGMPFVGFGIYGFDNVSQEFQGVWVDNCGTGMATGGGELSSDGKTMTWVLEYNCPITKKPTKLREVERVTGADTMTLEIYGIFPKTNKEYKMMQIDYKRLGDAKSADATGAGN